ncbi:MAG: hypothetical protein H7A21_09485 [Spirochaetales bacterium]|nr:hypothetical protein [Leptospiraceae bacterium]MCP5481653.1 hypothetical protein [Spirochaetales bacterium]
MPKLCSNDHDLAQFCTLSAFFPGTNARPTESQKLRADAASGYACARTERFRVYRLMAVFYGKFMSAPFEQDGNALRIRYGMRGTGCLYAGIGLIGGLLVLGAGLYLLASVGEEDTAPGDLLMGAFVLLFGLVFLLGSFSGRSFSFRSELLVEPDRQELRLTRTDSSDPIRIPFGQALRYEIHRVFRGHGSVSYSNSESTRGRGPTYQIFLVLRDGSLFWLYTSADIEQVRALLGLLTERLLLPVRDLSGNKLDQSEARQYENPPAESSPESSSFVSVERKGGETSIRILEKRSLRTTLLKVLVFLLFFGAPLLIFRDMLVTPPDWSSPHSYVFLVPAGIFAAFFLSVTIFMLLITLRSYRIVLRHANLIAELCLPWPLRFLSRSRTVTRDMIRQIRVNRLDEGHFWLSVALETSYARSLLPPSGLDFLFNVGAFSKTALHETSPDERVLGLWEVPGYLRADQGAGYHELRFIEKIVQQELGLVDGDLESYSHA